MSLAGDANTVEAVDNPYPYEHEMLGISSDRLAVRYHGISHTHLDALAHVNDDGVFYNGYAPDADAVAEGHPKNSIHNLKSGIVTRGVLIDIPRLRGVPGWSRERRSTSRTSRRGRRRRACASRPATRCSCARACGRAARPKAPGSAAAVPAGARPGCTRRSSRG